MASKDDCRAHLWHCETLLPISSCLKSVFCSGTLSLVWLIMMFHRLCVLCSNIDVEFTAMWSRSYFTFETLFHLLPSSVGFSCILSRTSNIVTRLGSFLFRLLNWPCVIWWFSFFFAMPKESTYALQILRSFACSKIVGNGNQEFFF